MGAGIAGLNALVVASEYLDPDGSIVLVDRRERGMWIDTYDQREKRTVADGLHRILSEHLEEVVDRDDGGVELLLRSGEAMAVEPGSWFVNCTGYLLKGDQRHEPAVSSSGKVLSINMRAHPLADSVVRLLPHPPALPQATRRRAAVKPDPARWDDNFMRRK